MGYIKGITIEIDGETKGLDAALKKVNTSTKKLQGELKRVEGLLKMNPGNSDLIRQKQELLSKSVSETKTKIDALRQAQKKMDAEGLDETNADYRRVQREIQETEAKLKSLTQEQVRFNIQSSKIGVMAGKMAQVGSKLSAVGQKLKTVTMAATLLGGAAVSIGKQFDESMSQVQAVSGATGDEFDQLRDKAREMGAKTKFSASDAADAMNYMAMAGWKTKQMLSGIEGIMNLAAASGEDLATTSDIVTDALTAMGYAAKDSGRLADVMAAASSNANTNVRMMGETFKYAAAVAGSMNYSMEDVALATGLMANSGIKASQAGTSLRSMISRMAAPTKQVSQAMDSLGVSIENADGTTRPFRDVMVDLRSKMAGLSDVEKTQIANSIAGKNAMSGFLAIINASDKDFNKLASAIDNSDGAAQQMADTMLDNFGGQITILSSSLQELAISVSDTLTPAVSKLAAGAQKLVTWFNNLSDGQKRVVVTLAGIAGAAGPVLIVLGGMLKACNSAVTAYANMAAKLVTSERATKLYKRAQLGLNTVMTRCRITLTYLKAGYLADAVAMTRGTKAVKLATIAQKAFNLVMKANPVVLIVSAIAALITVLSVLEAKGKNVVKSIDNFTVSITNKINSISKVMPQVIEGAVNGIIKNLPALIKAGTNMIVAIAKGLIKAIPAVVKAMPQIIAALVKAAIAVGKALITAGASLIKYLYNGIKSGFSKIITSVVNMIKNVIARVKIFFGKMKSAGVSLINNFLSGLKSKFSGVLSKVGSFARSIPSKIKSGLGSLKSIGSNLITGLWSGISNKVGWLKSQISGFVGNVKAWLKKFFKIGSPSRLMADEIGQWIPAGIAEGITGNMKSVKSAMHGMTETIESPSLQISAAGGNDIDYDRLANAMVKALSGIEMTSTVQMDGKTVAKTTAPFMQTELNKMSKLSNRKLGLV